MTRTSSGLILLYPLHPPRHVPSPVLRYAFLGRNRTRRHLAGTTLELLAEEDELDLVVDGQDTSAGNTTEDVGTSTLEEGLDALLGDDLLGGIERRLVLDGLRSWLESTLSSWSAVDTYLTRSHHHTTTDGVKRVGSDTGTGGDSPAEKEGSKEVTLKRTNEDDGLDRVVHAEVQTTVDDDTSNGGTETTVETGNTIGSKSLLVDVDETVELAVTTALGGLGVVGKTGTGVVERVDEEEGSGTSSTTGGKVTHHPLGVAITILLEGEHRLVGVTESEVQGLGREVTDDVGGVTTPQGDDTLRGGGTAEAVHDAVVLAVETTGAKHLILLKKQISVRSRDDVGVAGVAESQRQGGRRRP